MWKLLCRLKKHIERVEWPVAAAGIEFRSKGLFVVVEVYHHPSVFWSVDLH